MFVKFDSHCYARKPTGAKIGAITERLKAAPMQEVDAHQFCELVAQGRAWVGASFAEGLDADSFRYLSVFALDFDNKDEDTFIEIQDALARCSSYGLVPFCMYETYSNTEMHPKFRLVFDLGKVEDLGQARFLITALLRLFPEADQACSNVNRIFLGTNGKTYEKGEDYVAGWLYLNFDDE